MAFLIRNCCYRERLCLVQIQLPNCKEGLPCCRRDAITKMYQHVVL